MGKLGTLIQAGRSFGWRDGALRLQYEVQRGSGQISRRMRSLEGWQSWGLERIAPDVSPADLLRARREGQCPFFFSNARQLAPCLRSIVGREGEKSIVAEAEQILAGKLPFFGRLACACGFPPDWFQNPETGERISPNRPWTTMRFASPDYGDLKFILEPSRFLFVYPLARAYVLSEDERFAEAFWRAVEDWAERNPPMSGPLWVCGQESSLRILAWSFGLHAFLHSSATTAERVWRLVAMIAAHARRTELTVGYARSQRNNHLVSEAVGLWTAGTLYPELKSAAAWQNLGAKLLREAVLDRISPEGVYLQHSFNYQRMVLQLLLWTARLAELHGAALDAQIRDRTLATFELLRRFVDRVSGGAPNFGSNDGSLILPLACCDYGDFRPLLQAGGVILHKQRILEAGSWDEAALWLAGNSSSARENRSERRPPDREYFRVGGKNRWAFVRAGRYTRRPFQADQLHVDLWWDGLNLARDAGTYSYNAAPPWNNGLAGTSVHNTVMIDGRDQMRRAGRFLWVDWAQGSGRSFSSGEAQPLDCFEGEHDGYRRLGITHRRAVRYLADAGWVIVDDVLGGGEHEVRLHWLAPDLSLQMISTAPVCAVLTAKNNCFCWNLFSSSPGAASIFRAGTGLKSENAGRDAQLLGWESPTYGELRPAVSLVYRTKARLPVRLATVLLAGEKFRVVQNGDQILVCEEQSELYQLSLTPQSGIFNQDKAAAPLNISR